MILKSIAAAFSMFSAIPVPFFKWDEKEIRYFLCAFPLVGAVIGIICVLFDRAGAALGFPGFIEGAFYTVIPVIITGGIHYEGFADTNDALASHGSFEKKHEILKDPHIGSFAVIHLCVYFIWMFALWTAMPRFIPAAVVMIPMISRALSGIAVVSFPGSGHGGTVKTFSESADQRTVKIVLIAEDIVFSIVLIMCGAAGAAAFAAGHLVFIYYHRMSIRQFGGISGDLAGWFLLTAEKWMLTAFVLVQFIQKAAEVLR